MNTTLSFLSAALLLATTAQAQTPPAHHDGFVLSAGLLGAQGDAQDMTGKAWSGYGLQAGYEFQPSGYAAAFLPYVAYTGLPAKNEAAPTWSLTGLTAGFDVVYPICRDFQVLTGPTLTSWRINGSTLDPDSGTFNVGQHTAQGDTGLRLGWRLGGVFPLSRDLSLTVAFDQSQWRSRPGLPPLAGWNPSRPAYYSLLLNYHF